MKHQVLSRLSELVTGSNNYGVVLNPKTLEPYEIISEGVRVKISSVFEKGSAFFSRQNDDLSDPVSTVIFRVPAVLSGYPRIHIEGVAKLGSGQGVALYAAAACFARFTKSPVIAAGGAGVSSTDLFGGRTHEAAVWWNKAFQKGLTERIPAQNLENNEEHFHVFLEELYETCDEFDNHNYDSDDLDLIRRKDFFVDILTEASVRKHGLLLMDRNGMPVNKNMDLWMKLNFPKRNNLDYVKFIKAFDLLNPTKDHKTQFLSNMTKLPNKAESSGFDGAEFFPELQELS